MNKEQLDPLKKVEELTSKANEVFGKRGKSVFERYPLAFALLVIVGATLMSQGIKELIFKVSFLKEQPLTMFLAGIVILVITGTLYKKLDK
ncbi:hypothetical protein A2467_00205 [Candidatus Nomurabacteria bacterium RIFOXYC2_FULL_36_8]|nr:MAG: hypothetical protein UR97_C0001G0064 [Candidatus Nomurabacteria bacterium GW2011_GWE2_36_115]KKP94367.1 MAG: hypothetical protein US00_C0002G0063 [Candidatus Nomurabacteria bacterium GW2011_GWF2_36_126]KKP96806.1 MAG: hypothetical protein US04_C0001G0309 [Candidatus Nomurabacteria bacterium GW2011_GWD2_36_14]KKP99590.1 MAG: hypothetical protein US08_C0001G0272 [Candidatus Nomurabacteria bacterium GW2011_GWF2_36_19]KKQ05585.1 MAG: hypothetical protein US17_C0003G0064 [Candidatus Nomuraba